MARMRRRATARRRSLRGVSLGRGAASGGRWAGSSQAEREVVSASLWESLGVLGVASECV
eukprot:2243906-Rhodomonas_salina.1